MKFLYGIDGYYVDVTTSVANHCVVGENVILPETDSNRAQLFGDPVVGILKHVKIIEDDGKEMVLPAGTQWSRLLTDISFDFNTYVAPKPICKYRLAIACMFKDSAFYLKEWLAFHKAVGVEHFFLCDNNSTDNYMDILLPYIRRGEVTLTKAPGQAFGLWEFERDVHLPFFNRVLQDTRNSVEWLACIDSDEFIVPSIHDNILEILQAYPEHHALTVRWQLYGTSHVAKLDQNQLLIEHLVYKLPTDAPLNQSGKVICRPFCSHFVDTPHKIRPNPGWKAEILDVNVLRLNHYNMGDENYWKTVKLPFYRKILGPEADVTKRLEQNAFNDIKDTIIYRFIPKVRQLIAVQ